MNHYHPRSVASPTDVLAQVFFSYHFLRSLIQKPFVAILRAAFNEAGLPHLLLTHKIRHFTTQLHPLIAHCENRFLRTIPSLTD